MLQLQRGGRLRELRSMCPEQSLHEEKLPHSGGLLQDQEERRRLRPAEES